MKRQFTIVDRKLAESPDEHAPITIYTNPDENEKRYLIDVLKIDDHTPLIACVEIGGTHSAVRFAGPRLWFRG